MRTAAALICFFILSGAMTGPAEAQNQRATASARSGDTYLTIHNVRPAHEITPEAEIFALATHTLDEAARVEALSRPPCHRTRYRWLRGIDEERGSGGVPI